LWGGGATPSSRSAEREISLSALLFCELFSCAYIAKRKAAESCIIIVDTSKREWYNKENRQRGVQNEQEIHKGV
jgi:hypothetical protein